ncbi:MAG: hypothetical protein ACREVI_05505 [Steroidobacteraceae bacterium]
MLKKFVGSIMLSIVLVGCATTPKQQATSLQLQAFQSKEFEVVKTVAFGSVVSVFQDLGYIVESADRETGFITAGSPSANKTGFWEAMGGVSSHGQTKATAFVEEIRPGVTTVRLNFVSTKKKSARYGQATQLDTQILEPEPYRVAFGKIEDAIFIRSAR